MALSLFLAKFLGIYMLIVATIWLIRRNQFEAAIKDIILSRGVLALTGAIHLIVGLSIAISHPIWEWNWRGLITLIAYFTILQGIIRLAFPEEARNSLLKSFKKGYWIWIASLIVIGIVLTYYGFSGR